MKRLVRAKISTYASALEIAISCLVLLGTLISCVALFFQMRDLLTAFVTNTTNQAAFDHFLAFSIQLIIAVEFIKMLSKHTPGSTVEVLLVVIAKRVVVDDLNMLDILMGVIAIAVLFLIRKHLFNTETVNSYSGEMLFDGDTPVAEFNQITKADLPDTLGATLGEIIQEEFARTNRELRVHEWMKVGHTVLVINEMRDGQIYHVQALHEDEIDKHDLPASVLFRNRMRSHRHKES